MIFCVIIRINRKIVKFKLIVKNKNEINNLINNNDIFILLIFI